LRGWELLLNISHKLSEFSYGYGVTRECEELLVSLGFSVTPFLPSLIHEAEIGCDVHFDKPGFPLLIQFKLGHELKRFRRSSPSMQKPTLNSPFWRFEVDTAEPNGQYDRLLKAEKSGAEVYYIAPKFSNWNDYSFAYKNKRILHESLIMCPSEIENLLQISGQGDGIHKVVYDQNNIAVCSDPTEAQGLTVDAMTSAWRYKLYESKNASLAKIINATLKGFDEYRQIKIYDDLYQTGNDELIYRIVFREYRDAQKRLREDLYSRSKTEDDAEFAALGMEAWELGCQLVAVTKS
tara:strand:+ start:476 stop:1357 length:882 start_codon:yes stop_codon:yes gene_type:complete